MITREKLVAETEVDSSDATLMKRALQAGLGLLASIYEGDEANDSPAVETLTRGNPYAHLYAREIGESVKLEEPPKAT